MRIAAIVVSALVVAAPAAGTLSSTGFKGRVTIGPLTPVCSDTTPCSGPAKHVTLTFSRNEVRRHALTDSAGRYRVLLPHSGAYSVTANAGIRLRPMHVWAHRGVVAALDFSIDTGIR